MKERVKVMIDVFSARYPEPETALNFNTPFELLVATILSAQSTDKQVNKVTKKLFSSYNTPADFAELERRELEDYIKSIGLFRNKSKYIIETSQELLNKYEGRVPDERKELMKLPGVGRKTANVILACAFSRNTFPVDTHVFRVSGRTGLIDVSTVEEAEEQLQRFIPEKYWARMHHWLIFFGREICKARNPACEECPIKHVCKHHQEG